VVQRGTDNMGREMAIVTRRIIGLQSDSKHISIMKTWKSSLKIGTIRV